ncbi:MAG TPA: hypothetical protein VK750_02565 [Cytophagaceae bacterium]|jgi:hypothetical protein|nr:hypothetical protein [Cytophagaceae bacterium]
MKGIKNRYVWVMLLLVACALFAGCSSENKTSDENMLASSLDSSTEKYSKISDQAIGEIIKSIPSPLEISMLIKESGNAYDSKILNPENNYSKYNSNFKKALNLGIYGADLGYINIYDKSTDALSYLSSIKTLADELNVGQFYDFNTIKRLASNSDNIDSLLYITTSNFENINNFLYQQKRSDQCVLMLTGGWLEALHISCEVYKKGKKVEIKDRIGEQKIVLSQLMLLLDNYKQQPNINYLYTELQKLKNVYDKIEIVTVYKEPTMKEVDGILTIVDESESKINVTDQQIDEIIKIIEELRSKLTA